MAALDSLAERLTADPRTRALGYGGRITRQDAARYALQAGLEAVGMPAAEPAPTPPPSKPKRTRAPNPAPAAAAGDDPELAAAFAALEARGVTLQAVADTLGTALSSVSRWRSGGRKPRAAARSKILELAGAE
ncbi:MAG: hypothetical protein KC613_15860 [Myxococcales bacterium]|nr:hypothetical protein [Myxococcales bacterium]